MDQYLVLYVVTTGATGEPDGVLLLAIKHQKQFGFDMPGEK